MFRLLRQLFSRLVGKPRDQQCRFRPQLEAFEGRLCLNRAPIVLPDARTTLQGIPVTVRVLANDSDTDGRLVASSLRIVSRPDHGNLGLTADGQIVYQPNDGFLGTDTIVYRVSDNQGVARSTYLNVTVVPREQFTMTSPTGAGTFPTPISRVGGIVLDLVGRNGQRVVTQVAASSLFHGSFDSGSPTGFQGNPGTLSVVNGFTPALLASLGGGLSQVAVRMTLHDGDSGNSNFDEDNNVLLLNGVVFGNFSDVLTVETSSDGTSILSTNSAGGFRNGKLDTGFFRLDDPASLRQLYASLSGGSVAFQLHDRTPYDNHLDFEEGLSPALRDVELAPNGEVKARDDLAQGLPGRPLRFNVLANDSDPDTHLNLFTITVLQGPARGSLAWAGGLGTYTPANYYKGSDSFTYQLVGPNGERSRIATVSLFLTDDTNLSVRTVLTSRPMLGIRLTYEIYVINLGPMAAGLVHLVHKLPAGLRILSARSSAGRCSVSANRLTCQVNGLGADRTFRIEVTAQTLSSGKKIGLVRVTTDHDIQLSNNRALLVIQPADVSIGSPNGVNLPRNPTIRPVRR